MTILCIACFFKGTDFLKAAKAQGHEVLLLTMEKLKDEPWPREAVDSFFYLAGDEADWDRETLLQGISYAARTRHFDRIVALDDFDLEKAAALREHLRVPGMGDTRTRYFRDKLAMRMQAAEHDIDVPDFVHTLNDARIQAFMERVPGPWVLKPRSQASAAGIKKIRTADDLWPALDALGDERSFNLLEAFVPGDIYHVDGIVDHGEVIFSRAHRYTAPPMAVAHDGGIFATHTVDYTSEDAKQLNQENASVMRAMGLLRGVFHTEFIKGKDGTFYFLETSARVGGAHIAEMLEASSGINLWAEWARLESLAPDECYELPPVANDYSGILISLAKEQYPDTSAYSDPEVVWRLHMPYHVGLIVKSQSLDRVHELLAAYEERIRRDFHTSAPAQERPTH